MSPILTSRSTRKRAQVFEVLVLCSMDVTETAERLSKDSEREKKGDARRTYPIEVLGCFLVVTIGKINTSPAPTPPHQHFPRIARPARRPVGSREDTRDKPVSEPLSLRLYVFLQVFACAGISPIFLDRVHYKHLRYQDGVPRQLELELSLSVSPGLPHSECYI